MYGVQLKTAPNTGFTWKSGWDMDHPTLESARESRDRADALFLAARIIDLDTGQVVDDA